MMHNNNIWFSEGSRFMGGGHGRGGYDLWDIGPHALFNVSVFTGIFLIALLWTIAIKGYALWTAARRNEKWWFIALLVVNTFGLLELAYLLFFAKKVDLKNGIVNPDLPPAKPEAKDGLHAHSSSHEREHRHEDKEKHDGQAS
ncbi:MAG TPA: DUF5652 family protein, partial [Candidatus Paceibacterota bacterium]